MASSAGLPREQLAALRQLVHQEVGRSEVHERLRAELQQLSPEDTADEGALRQRLKQSVSRNERERKRERA